ncbi:hypothetical protein BDZ45DRAFT_750838 [Acephala macrosclerotiorum]|nr:hypothetical protein BDZ45DRAFT_750838 [Acephala macrosclerotiorum]
MESPYNTVLSLDEFLARTLHNPQFLRRVQIAPEMAIGDNNSNIDPDLPGDIAPADANPSDNSEVDALAGAAQGIRHTPQQTQLNYHLHEHYMYSQPTTPLTMFNGEVTNLYYRPSQPQTMGVASASSSSLTLPAISIQEAARLYEAHHNLPNAPATPKKDSGSDSSGGSMPSSPLSDGQALPLPNGHAATPPIWAFCCDVILPAGDLFFPSTRYLYTHLHVAQILAYLIKNPNRPTQSLENHFNDQVTNADWLISISDIIEHAALPNNLADPNGSAGNQSHLENSQYYISGYNRKFWHGGFIRLASQEDLNGACGKMKELDFDTWKYLRVGCPKHGKDFAVKIWAMEEFVERELATSRDVARYEAEVRAKRLAETGRGLGGELGGGLGSQNVPGSMGH